MTMTSVSLPTGGGAYADKNALAENGTQFGVTAVADGSYNGKPQYNLTIVDEDGDECILTLGAGGSRDGAIKVIREALANGAEAVGPFVLRTFPTKLGNNGFALANA